MTIHRPSGFDPADNICWQFGNKGDRNLNWERKHRSTCPACSRGYGERGLATFGRCRSGQRWFWYAAMLFDGKPNKATGYAASEDEATCAAMDAVRGFRDGIPILAHAHHGHASLELKQLNAAKRRAKPPSDAKDVPVVEYLYSGDRHLDDYDSHSYLVFYRFRITKRTAKRIFYVRGQERIDEHGEPINYDNIRSTRDTDNDIGFIDRAKLAAEGSLYSSHTWCEDWHLFSSLEAVTAYFCRHDEPEVKPADLAALKQAMAEAHPDRGGSSAAFIEARQRYVAARRAHRSQPHDRTEGGAP